MSNTPTFGQPEIEEVLAKVRARVKAVGAYQAHNLSDDDYYKVTLDNGSILLFTAEIKDRHKLMPDRINDVAARFRPARKS